MDKQFNVKDFLLLMVLTIVVLLLLGCGGSDEGDSPSSSNPPSSGSTRPAPDQGATAQLERLTLTAYPIKTKGTSELTLLTGGEQSFLAVGEYSNGQSKVLTEELTVEDWLSSDTELGEFIQSGVLKGKASGVVTVSFSKGNLTSNSLEVTVTDATITDITITPSAVRVAKGYHQPLTATATYNNGLSMNISDSVTWVSDDPSKTTITPQTDHGLLNGVGVGSTTVTAIKEGITSQSVGVEVSDAVITAINVTPAVVSIAKGQHQTLTANAVYSDNTSSDISDSVTWRPVDNSTAMVTSSGVLSGSKVGKTTLTAVKDNITSNTIGVVVSDAVITGISVTPSAVTVARGQTQSLTANAIFSDNTSLDISDSVSWRPVDNHTATVTSDGVLSGGNVGITTLTAVKDGVASNTVDVEVSDAVITSISVTPPIVTLAKGQNQALKATATYSDNTSSDISDSVSWRPVDNSTATVTSNGVLSGGNVGTTTLTALKDGVDSNTVDVEVTNAEITGISVTPPQVNIAKGQNQALTATATYSDNTSSDISDFVTWSLIDNSTATVTSDGVLSGGKVGTTTLTAVKGGVTSNPVGVVVTDAVITGISVTPPNVTVAKGNNQPLTATAIYSDLTSSDVSRFVTWTPLDTSTAIVTLGGLLTGANVGTTSVTASKDGVTSNTVSVDVSNAVITGLTVTPSIINVAKGQHQPLTATATYSDNTSSDVSGSVTWTSSRSKVSASPLSIGFTAPAYFLAHVTPQGLLTGSIVGTTSVTASKDGITSNTVDVNVTNAVVTDISVTPTMVSVAKGQKEPLKARATYSDGTSSDVSGFVTWIPVDSSTAAITPNGLLTGGKVGTTTLTAVKDGVTSNTVDVDVTNAVITSINVTPATISVAKGYTQPLTAKATYSDSTSSDVSDSVSWVPVDNHTATVTSHGLLSGGQVGTTTLTAAKDGVTSNIVDVDVTNAVMTGLTVSPPAIGVIKGQTQPLTATAHYSDGTSTDVSNSVMWLIPVDTDKISMTSDGIVSGLNSGSTTITASHNAFTADVDVNVCNGDSSGLTGKCIDLFNTGNGKLFTNPPSVAYLNSLGLGGSTHTEGTDNGGMFYKFTWTKANALCPKYNTIKLAGRSNWRLPTVDELSDELYAYCGVSPSIRGKLSTERGWTLETHYWASTAGNSSNTYWSVYMYNNWKSDYVNSFRFYASCVSEP
ncbi:Ig-like domain-containing protein [Vibrio sp. T11.5]|uniref:Ig-like domain-containing protein n=1 Tax=Vibrio sp. T11.5 TaxID=2998836 RepID=UPI0022CD6F17|nr:Ig-like domain-containing protein [Vibrio sp. T11.5]MDA0116891.1 Ig-like domain-containing protein [Vibrio sp. T11.5]